MHGQSHIIVVANCRISTKTLYSYSARHHCCM